MGQRAAHIKSPYRELRRRVPAPLSQIPLLLGTSRCPVQRIGFHSLHRTISFLPRLLPEESEKDHRQLGQPRQKLARISVRAPTKKRKKFLSRFVPISRSHLQPNSEQSSPT